MGTGRLSLKGGLIFKSVWRGGGYDNPLPYLPDNVLSLDLVVTPFEKISICLVIVDKTKKNAERVNV